MWLIAITLAARWDDRPLRLALLVLAALLVGVAPGQTLVPPTVQAIFSSIVQTGGAIALAVIAMRVARAGDTPVPA
jgi:hypothetical protein